MKRIDKTFDPADNCLQCGKPRPPGRRRMYCSPYCGQRAWRQKNPAAPKPNLRALQPCANCGKDFQPKSAKHRYCQLRCKQGLTGAGKEWSKGKEYVPRRMCEVCNAMFYAPPVLVRRGGGRFCSVACRARKMASNPTTWPQTQTRRGKGGRRPDLDNRYFRSTWEANWARYLNWLVERKELERWEFETETFEFPVKRGSKFYTPDFKLVYADGSIVYHEVKGYMDQKSATKLRRMKTHHPKIDIRLIDKRVYAQVAAKVASMIPGWEKGLKPN